MKSLKFTKIQVNFIKNIKEFKESQNNGITQHNFQIKMC